MGGKTYTVFMKKKSSQKLSLNSPISFFVSWIPILILILKYFAKNPFLDSLFICNGAAFGSFPFKFNSFTNYISIFLHPFGSYQFTDCFCASLCIFFLGSENEERYGSALLLLLILLATLVSGVFSVCFNPLFLTGSAEIVFLFFILSFFQEKSFPLAKASAFFVYFLFVLFSALNFSGEKKSLLAVPVLIQLLGASVSGAVCYFSAISSIKKNKNLSKKAQKDKMSEKKSANPNSKKSQSSSGDENAEF